MPQKTAVTSGLNAIYYQTPGNLFPLCRLKDNCTFTTQAVTVGNAEGEADSGAKQEETEASADKEVKASGRVKELISLWSISITLPRWSNYTNRKTEVVLGAGIPATTCRIAQKTLANLHVK